MKYKDFPLNFHDAQLESVNIDYLNKRVVIIARIVEGLRNDGHYILRRVETVFSDFAFCVVEPPDARYPYKKVGSLKIDIGDEYRDGIPASLPPVESENFLTWVWVNDWNAFIHIAASDMSYSWLEESNVPPGEENYYDELP